MQENPSLPLPPFGIGKCVRYPSKTRKKARPKGQHREREQGTLDFDFVVTGKDPGVVTGKDPGVVTGVVTGKDPGVVTGVVTGKDPGVVTGYRPRQHKIEVARKYSRTCKNSILKRNQIEKFAGTFPVTLPGALPVTLPKNLRCSFSAWLS